MGPWPVSATERLENGLLVTAATQAIYLLMRVALPHTCSILFRRVFLVDEIFEAGFDRSANCLDMVPKFPIGLLVATPGALRAFNKTGEDPHDFVRRHESGDWGHMLSAEDRIANDRAVKEGSRILSAYMLSDGTKIWVITEADRSSTCVLLPEDY